MGIIGSLAPGGRVRGSDGIVCVLAVQQLSVVKDCVIFDLIMVGVKFERLADSLKVWYVHLEASFLSECKWIAVRPSGGMESEGASRTEITTRSRMLTTALHPLNH